MNDERILAELPGALAGRPRAMAITATELILTLTRATGVEGKEVNASLRRIAEQGAYPFWELRTGTVFGKTAQKRYWWGPEAGWKPGELRTVERKDPLWARLDEILAEVRNLSVTKSAEVVIGTPLQTEADQIETLRADRNQWLETANFYKERCRELEAEIAELKGE